MNYTDTNLARPGKHHRRSTGGWARALAAATLLAGCGRERDVRQAPPAQQVQAAVAGALPAYCALLKLEWEPIATGPESVKVNFKASVELTEDLYVLDREVEGPAKVTLLKGVQSGGARRALYGHLVAHRLIDQWTLDAPQFHTDVRPWGQPRGAFGARAYVAGSAAANAAVRAQAAETEQLRQLQQAVTEQQAREQAARAARQARDEEARAAALNQGRLALAEQSRQESALRAQAAARREQAAAAARQRLLTATAPGSRYRGTRTGLNAFPQPLALVFLPQAGPQLRAEASNPDNPGEKRIFSGELRFKARPDQPGAADYPIILHGDPGNTLYPEPNSIYERAIDLKLRPTDQGLEGVADAGLGTQFPIHLQRAGGGTNAAPAVPAAAP